MLTMKASVNGFSLIEMSIVVVILVILGIVAALSVDNESGDASLVRSTQGSMQAAIMSIASSTRANVQDVDVIDSAAALVSGSGNYAGSGIKLVCDTTDCTLTLASGRVADFDMLLTTGFTLTSITGFSNYAVVAGELQAS